MSRFALAVLISIFALIPPAGAQSSDSRTISVSGEAEIRVVPDQVLISMTAENRGADLASVKTRNDTAVKGLVDYVTKTLGVEPQYVQTDFVSIEPAYKYCDKSAELFSKCNPLDIAYYTVRKGIQIRLGDLTKYEDLITRALELGVTTVDNIQFSTTQLRQSRDKARELAAIAAREKAQALAATLGVKLSRPVTVSDQGRTAFYWNGNGRGLQVAPMQNVVQNAPGQADGDGDSLALGQINISATVQVTYEIE